ncbi:hypothetical protein GUJ93_ZPchr0007g5713 [Zizania palustris]|uniref:CRIB domain-containing protein n=1 Tax=Zizania palustris TaxID=103762 RepID=A0A8J5TEN7_ZIZPA|nr:hypothetical protein GUJ93_ZPchr0007g5713 [Zizania palustris]KAG8080739.1 hypothetical protein GUJ93_ZPchr0007g5713 [Zizania palustris]
MSSTKMKKGILRPFRYISNMMDGKESQELQIGFPTDVKHVAHIGWDGPGVTNNNAAAAAAPTWMKDYHSAPLDSSSFRSERGTSAASNPWSSQEIVLDGGGLGDTSFRETKSEAGDITAGDSPPSPNTRRSRRHRSRGSATSSMDCTGTEASEKKEKTKKSSRGKNRKKDKADKPAAGDDAGASAGSTTCQDLPAVPKKSTRRKNKGSSEGSGCAAAAAAAPAKDDAAGAAPDEAAAAAPLPPATEEANKDHE